MGILSALGLTKTEPAIKAQYAPPVMSDTYQYQIPYNLLTIDRISAMSIPAVARCRNLICGVIGSMELSLQLKRTDEEIPKLPWMDQPSLNQPMPVTLAFTCDSLLFFGVAYWEITEVYADNGYPARFNWVANSRVIPKYNKSNTFIEGYQVDGFVRPMSGVGSLVTFQSMTDGILNTGARTLTSALDLDKAAAVAAATPMPSGVLKNSGADLGEAEVQGLLSAWRNARNNRSTAYLTSTLDFQPAAFSPKDMMLNEAKQYMATEIARLCNVPAYYISADMNNSMTYSNVQDERRQFVSLSLQPYISAIESRLSMNDITPSTQYIEFDLDSGFLRANPMERLNVIEKMLNLGLIDVQQAMAMEELSPNGSASASNIQ
jgi:HK97 family phage portal protein